MPSNTPPTSRVAELFGYATDGSTDWSTVVANQECPYVGKRCFKNRKSDAQTSIGTCVVRAGKGRVPLIICPNRFIQGGLVFADAVASMDHHHDGNEMHVVKEVHVPGGSVDYFLVSVSEGKIVDFVGIEFQGLDTTGTVWPARQQFLADAGALAVGDVPPDTGFAVNWKMTAKTILMQLHHKVETFESLNKKLILVLQDDLMRYMKQEFSFTHLTAARSQDALQFHPYRLVGRSGGLVLEGCDRLSTDAAGVARALELGQSGSVPVEQITGALERKMTMDTVWKPGQGWTGLLAP